MLPDAPRKLSKAFHPRHEGEEAHALEASTVPENPSSGIVPARPVEAHMSRISPVWISTVLLFSTLNQRRQPGNGVSPACGVLKGEKRFQDALCRHTASPLKGSPHPGSAYGTRKPIQRRARAAGQAKPPGVDIHSGIYRRKAAKLVWYGVSPALRAAQRGRSASSAAFHPLP